MLVSPFEVMRLGSLMPRSKAREPGEGSDESWIGDGLGRTGDIQNREPPAHATTGPAATELGSWSALKAIARLLFRPEAR